MQGRSRASRVLAVGAVAGLVLAAQLVAAPPAHACAPGQLQDTVTGMCWSQSGQGESFGGPAEGPCLPGRLGTCLGSLEKSSPATGGRNAAVPCGFGPEGGYPCGNW